VRQLIKNKLIRNGSYVFLFKLVGMACGLLFNTLLVAYFGANDRTDALLVALIIPLGLADDILRIVNMLVIPQIVRFRDHEPGRLWEFFLSFVLSAGFVTVLVIGLLWLVSAPLMGTIAPGFSGSNLVLVREYFVKSLGLLLLLAMNSILQSLAHAEERFLLPSLAGSSYKIFSIAGLALLHGRFGLDSVFFGFYAGALVQTGLLLPVLMRFVRSHARSGSCSFSLIVPLVPALMPILIGSLAAHLNGMVGKYFASFLGPGGVTTLDLAQKIILTIPNLVVIPLATAMFPSLARWIQDKDFDQLHDNLGSSVHTIILIAGAIMVMLAFFNQSLVALFFGYGEFSQESIRATSANLQAYGFGVIPLCLNQLVYMVLYLNRSLFALAIVGSLNVAVSFAGNSLLVGPFGAQGIAASTSLASWSLCLVGIALIHRRGLLRLSRADAVALGKTLLSLAVAAPLLFLVPRAGFAGGKVLALATMGAAFLVLLLPALLMRIKSAMPILMILGRKRAG
jgi:putative peptidoglycan lipid II flippase